jgi:type II secretory pathway component GspD/PulD (secretin)
MSSEQWLLGSLFAALLAALSGAANGADLVVEVFRLQHRTAEQVLPLIVPIVAPGTASGAGREVVVRTTRRNLAAVREVLARIDRAPRRLVVTVRHDAGDDATNPRASAGTYATRQAESDRFVQRVQVNEGESAYVYVGQSLPVVLHGGRAGVGSRDAVGPIAIIRETLSGIVVRARVTDDDAVVLDIEPRHDAPGASGPGSVELQRVATTLTGPLGAWIELGAVQPAVDDPVDSATSYATRSAAGRPRRILVRVDAAQPTRTLNPGRALE